MKITIASIQNVNLCFYRIHIHNGYFDILYCLKLLVQKGRTVFVDRFYFIKHFLTVNSKLHDLISCILNEPIQTKLTKYTAHNLQLTSFSFSIVFQALDLPLLVTVSSTNILNRTALVFPSKQYQTVYFPWDMRTLYFLTILFFLDYFSDLVQ